MRLAPLLLLAFTVLTAQPALAAKESLESSPVFGRGFCKPTFPCSDLGNSDASREVTSKVVGIANRCIMNNLAMRGFNEYIESSFGLDTSLCLTTKDIPRSKDGATMVPKCCVKPISSDGKICQVMCTKYGVR